MRKNRLYLFLKKIKKPFFKVCSLVLLFSLCFVSRNIINAKQNNEPFSYNNVISVLPVNSVVSSTDLQNYYNSWYYNFYDLFNYLQPDELNFFQVEIHNLIDLGIIYDGNYTSLPNNILGFEFLYSTYDDYLFEDITFTSLYTYINGVRYNLGSTLNNVNIYFVYDNSIAFTKVNTPSNLPIAFGLNLIDYFTRTYNNYNVVINSMIYKSISNLNDFYTGFTNRIFIYPYSNDTIQSQFIFKYQYDDKEMQYFESENDFLSLNSFNTITINSKVGFITAFYINELFSVNDFYKVASDDTTFESATRLLWFVGTLPIYYLQQLFSFELLGVRFYNIVFSFVALGVVLYFLLRRK